MYIERLQIQGVRNLTDVDITLSPGINFFSGLNGAGKTSLLEAVYSLATGRSFRTGLPRDIIQHQLDHFRVIAQLQRDDASHTLGLERSDKEWTARLNGSSFERISELAENLVTLVFHPSSHDLIEGSPDNRRQFIDYTTFHVEHQFINQWRTYRHLLKQRNAAIRHHLADESFDYWEQQLALSAEQLSQQRQLVVNMMADRFGDLAEAILPEYASLKLSYHSGWKSGESLLTILQTQRAMDRTQGYTRSGPHRADLRILGKQGRVTAQLSRGQQKSLALILMLCQAEVIHEARALQPIILLDDFPSELDPIKQADLLTRLQELDCQILLTGVECPQAIEQAFPLTMFHVEHGVIS